jgi:hypothetical protein
MVYVSYISYIYNINSVKLNFIQHLFLISTATRPVLGPTQPPIQGVPRALSLGSSVRGVKLTPHLYLVPRSRIVEF